jgi:tetratricopeptide (TPR) repeat protein
MPLHRLLSTFLLLLPYGLWAQGDSLQSLIANLQRYRQQGDYVNALVIAEQGLRQFPQQIELLNERAYCQLLNKNYAAAVQLIEPLLHRTEANVPTFQIAALIYRALSDRKRVEQAYAIALKKFPQSGVLHNDFGELRWEEKDPAAAIASWEEGIRSDPNYPGNYYHAALYYLPLENNFWGLLYGELFVNLESFTERTTRIKKLLWEGNKRFYANLPHLQPPAADQEFERACFHLLRQELPLFANGISLKSFQQFQETFTRNWFDFYAQRFPFRLFDHYRQMIRMNLMEAYLNWLAGEVVHPEQTKASLEHLGEAQQQFFRLQQNRVFKIPAGQYYHIAPAPPSLKERIFPKR